MYTVPNNRYTILRDVLIALFVAIPFWMVILMYLNLNLFESGFIGLIMAALLLSAIFFFVLAVSIEKEPQEAIRLTALQKKFDHLYAKNAAMDRGCTPTMLYTARIVGEMVRINPKYFSEDSKSCAAELAKHITYGNAVEWMRNEGSYVERFAITATLFKLAEEGMISPNSVYIYREMNLGQQDYKKFDSQNNEFKKQLLQQQQRQNYLKGLCKLAIARLVGEMLRLNNTNYQQRAFKAVKTVTKLTTISYTFFNNALQTDQISVSDAIDSVCYGLPIKKRLKFVTLLFELAVDDDGIKNDEWRLMLQVLAQMNFEEETIAEYVEHYQSLRTEFDTDEFTKTIDEAAVLKEYREVLGVDEDATVKEIQDAFHRLALKYHPDLPKNANRRDECHEKMAVINNAYAQLVVKKKKEEAEAAS